MPEAVDRQIRAKMTFTQMTGLETMAPEDFCTFERDISDESSIQSSLIAYHQSRTKSCGFLSVCFTVFKRLQQLRTKRKRLQIDHERLQADLDCLRARWEEVLDSLPARNESDDLNKSLLEDFIRPIELAISDETFFVREVQHCLYSLWNAYAKQL